MDIGAFVIDIVYTVTVGAWIGFIAPPLIWAIRHRRNMPWEQHRFPIQTGVDLALGIVSLVCLALLLRI